MAGSRRRKNVNTKRSGNTRGRNTSLSAINKNKPATKKTVASKPKSTTTNKSTVSGRALRNESARKANTGNTQRQKKTTKPQERKSFSSRMNNYQGTSGNRRKQMTTQTQKTAQDNLKKTAGTMKNLTKGNIKQITGSHATTFNSIRNPNEEMYARAEEFKRQRGDYDNQKKLPYSEGQYGQLLNRERNNKEQREKNLAKASRKIDSGTKLIEKEKDKMGEAGKFAADLYGAGLGLASDALAGPASMVSMFSRSYGSSYKTAKDEGATDSQAALYGAAAGGLEVATERLFAVAKPLQKIYGKGAGDKIFDTLLDKVAKKATSKGANDLIYHGGKTLGSFVSEALEEMIVEGLEPSIANQIYAEAVGTPHETSAKDVLYAGLLGGAMGGILGGGGQIMEYSRGEQVKDIYGEDGLKAAADRVSQADEDSGNGAMGTLVKDMISAGEDVNARYANELYRADQAQMAKDSEKLDVARTVAENSIRRENLKSPVAVDGKGEIMLSRNTKAKYDETVARAQEEADKLQVPDLTREKLAESVARIQTGTADVNDVNLFLLNNPKARTVYQVVTGESLPKTNQETRQYLYEKIGNNLITAAKIETADHADRIKGVMEQNLSTDYEVSGQEAFAQHFQGIDVRNVQQVEHDVITFDDYYRAARNGISYEQVEAYQNPIHMEADTEFKRMAYEAGQRDVAISLDTAKGMQLELGKAVSKSSLKQRSRAGKGRLISEISPEMQMEFSASQQIMYRMLARAFNINIHVVDTLQNEDGAKTNGYYVDGEVYLSLDGDRSLEYIFAHEITHHMQAYAPKEYNQLKELVRQRWAQKGGIDAAVNAKKAQYAKGGVNLSYEDALDEIIADSTYEMLQDEGFVDELCRSHRNVAQRLLDAIRDVLAKLRNVLAEGDSFTPQQNAGLLSELDILKDFERIWANGLMRAAENSDAVTKGNVLQVKYSKHDDSTIKDQIAANLDVLNAMEPVANITYESIAHLSRSQKADLIFEEFSKQFKGGLERKGFGYIVLRYDEITNSLKYLHTDGEFAAFFTVPKVLKRGIVIKEKIDHKSKKEDTVTIAAPVVINGVRGNVGAIVKLGGKKRYHVHRILMPDGSVFNFENKKTEPNGVDMITNNGKQGPTISSALNKSISDSQQKGNKKLSLPDTDSTGRELSEGQQTYFAKSKIRDEDGNLLVVYHGTSEDFTVFDRTKSRANMDIQGNFFSPWDLDARGYGENVRPFYLNITNPAPEGIAYKALNKFAGQNEAGIKAREYLVSLGYDGVNNGDEEYIAFYPHQIKNIDNENPTEDPDIRYSLPDEEAVYDYINSHETEFVEVPPVRDYERKGKSVKDKSIEELQKQVEILKRDKKLTHGKVLNKNSIREQLNILVRTLMSHSEGTANKTDGKLVKTALENAEIIFKAIKDGDVYTAATTSYYAAEHIVENLKLVDDTMFNEYKDLRDYLRTTKVTISEQDRSNISDFKEFRKRNMGRIRITNEGGMAVDDLYQTLCERWPGMFDPEITHPADQLQEIADVRDQLDPYDVMLSEEETKQLIKEAAHDLLEISANGKPWQSWADRQRDVYDQKVKKLKARHVEALRDVRTKANEKADERVKAEREKAKNKAEAEKMAVAREQAEKKRAQQESQERKNAESEKRRHINRIEKDLKWLSDRLLKPTDAKHLPDGYQKAIAELLVMVDPQSARSKKLEEAYGISKKRANFLRLKAEYENIAKSEAEGMIYNEDIANWCDELAKTLADADSIAEATVEEMRVISQLIKAITHSIRQQNKAFDENLKSGIAEAARETIHKAKTSRKTGQRGGIPGALGTLMNESMVSPRDFFEGIGGGINKAFMSIRKGHDKHIENITEARTFFADLFGQYANKKKPGSAIEEWRNYKTNEKFELDGGTVTMNISQRMALYCLLKREQAAGHIFGSGIVVAEASTMNKLKEALGAKKDLNFGTTRVTMQEAYDIVKTLTPEQIEIADKLQDFLNGACAEWGNEASLKMFGYKKFTEENYFPIQSADVYLDSNFEGRQAVERIRNFGFTKETVVNANNPIVIDDIFTVVADHVNKMSMYNAFAAPIADFTRVYNFKSRDDSGLIIESTKDVLANTYGKKVGRYITNFIADLQSNTQTRQEGFTRFVNKTLANYKKASIAANIRVALQQPTALVRAFTVIDPKYFVLKNHTPLLLQKATGADTDYKDMLDHCPIARWKSWGFSQVDMARDIDDIMMNKEWNKLDFVTMQLYGALDLYTWSKIWGAVRAETKAKHPEVKVDSEEFYAICNERASEVFDKTQVVDSVLHRSQVMRNTDTMSKVLTSFMAEPTRTYNMVRSEYAAAMDMWADGEKAKAGAKVARASSVYLFNALACAAAAAVADALRGKDLDDDDEPETWWELTKENFMSNANPLNLLPVFKEVSSIWKGWDTSNMALEGIEALVKAEKGIVDKLKGESDKPWSELIRKQAEAIGLVFGVPVKNILREAETWSKIIGIDVFAAEVGEEVEEEKKILKIEDGSDFDNFLNMFNINLSDKEMMDKNFDKTVKSYNKATKDMTEAEKQEYLWEKITDGYTKDIEAGDYDSINNMRRLLKETGGDYEKFNESVISRTKTEMKKTIGVDSAATEEYRYQLKRLGMTDEIINQEVVMKSDAAKAFQLEACEDDYDGMVETIRTLYDAGLSEVELDVLYYNRTKAVSAKDYQTGSLVAPCNGEITSTFGYRNAPTAGASSNHKGIDIAVAANTEIVAADGGKVSSAGYNSGYGYYVKVYHGNGRYTMYAHLNGYYKDKGMAVAKGEAIGLSGSTGVSTGPHLHFEVIENGVNVDPLPYLQ